MPLATPCNPSQPLYNPLVPCTQPKYKEQAESEDIEMLYLVFSVTFAEILDLIIVDMLLAFFSFFFVLFWLWCDKKLSMHEGVVTTTYDHFA